MPKPKERDARLMEAISDARRLLANLDTSLCRELGNLVPFVSCLLELSRRHAEEFLALEVEEAKLRRETEAREFGEDD